MVGMVDMVGMVGMVDMVGWIRDSVIQQLDVYCKPDVCLYFWRFFSPLWRVTLSCLPKIK
jgi:hypothetical protein